MVLNDLFLIYFGDYYGDSGHLDHKEYLICKCQTKNKIMADSLECIFIIHWDEKWWERTFSDHK